MCTCFSDLGRLFAKLRTCVARYDRVRETVFQNGAQKRAATRIIGHIICAARTLKWRELQAIFFIDPSHNTSDFEGKRLHKTCKQICGSLVDIRPSQGAEGNEGFAELVHDSARR